MGQDPVTLIIHTLGSLYAFMLVLRFLLQLAGADYYNPISQAVVRVTAVPLRPLQKLLPRVGRMDLSPLVLAFGVNVLTLYLMSLAQSLTGALPAILLFSAVTLVDTILTIYFWAVIGAVDHQLGGAEQLPSGAAADSAAHGTPVRPGAEGDSAHWWAGSVADPDLSGDPDRPRSTGPLCLLNRGQALLPLGRRCPDPQLPPAAQGIQG